MATVMLWKKFDILDQPVYLRFDDECFYARDYVSHGRYDASEGNNLISNLKKPIGKRGTFEWKHKLRAIQQFANELKTIIPSNAVVAAIPSSKCRTDPEFDPRLDDVLAAVHRLDGTITIERPIDRPASGQAVHLGADRKINDIYSALQWNGFQAVPPGIILIDDLITCGTHFKACQRLILEHHPGLPIYGVFWARTVWPTPVPVP